MKKLFGVLVLSLGLGACQPQTSSTQVVQTQGVAEKPLVTIPLAAGVAHMLPAADTLTAPMLAMLRQYDFDSLWMGEPAAHAPALLDGFFGENHRHIAFVFTEIHRDSLHPDLFYLHGKSRFNKVITPFAGTLQVKRLADLDDVFMFIDSASQVYTARAAFRLREDSTATAGGEFTGTALVDFFTSSTLVRGRSVIVLGQGASVDEKAPAKGAGLVFRGKWTSYSTHLSKPVLLSKNIFIVAPEILPDFGIGDRAP